MRIGLLAPPWVPVPPPSYGGTEVVVDNLARGLSHRGHQVWVFTVADSTTPVHRLHYHRHPAERMGDTSAEAAHVLAGYAACTMVTSLVTATTFQLAHCVEEADFTSAEELEASRRVWAPTRPAARAPRRCSNARRTG